VGKEGEAICQPFGGMNNSFTNSQTLNTSEDLGGLISLRNKKTTNIDFLYWAVFGKQDWRCRMN